MHASMHAKNFRARAVSYLLACSSRVFYVRMYNTRENKHANQLEGESRTYIVPYVHLWCM